MKYHHAGGRSKFVRYVCGVAVLCLSVLALPGHAQGVPSAITYQGKLTSSPGSPVADGNYSLTVKFYSVETLGAATWTSPPISVTTTGGVFTARIEGIPSTAMPGPDVWIETMVGADTLAPRVKLASVPFALRAGGLSLATGASAGYVMTSDAFGNGSWQPAPVGAGGGGGIGGAGTASYIPWWTGTGMLGNSVIYEDGSNNIGIGTTTPAAGLDVLASTNPGLRAESTAAGGVGITGVANNSTRWVSPIGVHGTSTNGIGVQGDGTLYGVFGSSTNGTGVDAYGGTYGVSAMGPTAVSANGTNIGVEGNGSTYGVHGMSSTNVGVQADGATYGVYATSSGTGSTGLYATGDQYGVYAVNTGGTNNGNTGVFAQSTTGPGVYGRAFSATGVQGVSDSGDGTYGYTSSGRGAVGVSGSGSGVLGVSTSASGVTGTSDSGTGVYGSSSSGTAIWGVSSGVGVCGQNTNMVRLGWLPGVSGVGNAEDGGWFVSTQGSGIYASGGYWGADIKGGSQGGINVDANHGAWGATINGGSQGGIWTTANGGLWGESITGGTEGGITANANGGKWGASITGGLMGGIVVSGGAPNRAAQFWGNTEVIGNVYVYSTSPGAPMVAAIGEGLDYAEGFDVSSGGSAAPGTVLIIDTKHPGKLAVSRSAYDRKVAGIVAGAKGLGSGVKLGLGKYDHNVALAGRVYCNVDATTAGVEPGDLLTTSPAPGYAMKAGDYSRAQGAILGKAMEGLAKGKKGQILVLVTLQ